MNRTTSLFLIGLLFLSACSSGSDFYKSSYPSYLKNGSTKKTSTPSHSNKISPTERSANEFQFETKESSDNQVFSGGSSIQDSTNLKDYSGHLISHGTIKANDAVLYLPAENNDFYNHVALGNNQNDCPAITDLACQYLGDGVYKLTWSVPKNPIYTENGTLSEYRINRRTLEDPKAFVYKTPEPNCVDGTCTVIFNNLNNRTGYIWTVDTRCTKTNFTSSNSVLCGPNREHSSISENQGMEKNDMPYTDQVKNKKALWSFRLVFILAVLGILTISIFWAFGLFAFFFLLFIILLGCILSILLGVKALKEINADEKNQIGKGRATLGIIGSAIGIILTIFFSNILPFIL